MASMMLLTANSQTSYSVGTSVEKKKVLLEEFTGQGCYWCTEGHQMAKLLLMALDGNAYAIAEHTGSLSGVYQGIDLRTDMSNVLGEYYGSEKAGYPCGMVNRCDFFDMGNCILSRSQWMAAAKLIIAQDAPVNLYQKAVYDGTTNTLTVHIEGYYTAAEQQAEQNLCVVLTQSGIRAYQNGGGNDYEHNHVLRDNLTPVWGTKLDSPKQGDYFVRDYTYELPEGIINGVQMKPEDIEVLSFVTAGQGEVLNVTGGKPEYQNYGEELGAQLSEPLLPIGNRYGYNFFELTFRNMSTQIISSLTFDVTVNDVTQQQEVTCELGQYATKELRVPATYTYAEKGKTKYEVKLTAMNGEPVEPVVYSGSFLTPKTVSQTVVIQMMTDNSPEQNRWLLKDAEGNVVQEFGPFTQKAATIEETVSLEPGTYCFEVTDEYGDGLLNGKKGGLIIHDGSGSLVDQFYQINGWGTRSFFTVEESPTGIDQHLSPITHQPSPIYDLQGRLVCRGYEGTMVRGYEISNKEHDSNLAPSHPRTSAPSIRKGIYIQNGRKIIIK